MRAIQGEKGSPGRGREGSHNLHADSVLGPAVGTGGLCIWPRGPRAPAAPILPTLQPPLTRSGAAPWPQVLVEAKHKGRMCGLCGNFDGKRTNEFLSEDGRCGQARAPM